MKFSESELPSNKKFGLLFCFVFFFAIGFFYFKGSFLFTIFFITASLIFLFVAILFTDKLSPLNKLWMKFGLLIGIIANPIIMGIIFFGFFTPISIVMRLFGRDELSLRFKSKNSYWILYDSTTPESNSFEQQF